MIQYLCCIASKVYLIRDLEIFYAYVSKVYNTDPVYLPPM